MLPTQKEMMLDMIEMYTRWLLIAVSFIVCWIKVSEVLDTFIGVPV